MSPTSSDDRNHRPAPGDVWAPWVEVLRLEVAGDHGRARWEERDGARDTDGWWHPDAPLVPGDRYRYRVGDAGDVVADPGARWLPDGVDGPAAVDDPGGFDWQHDDADITPWERAVVYELHVGTFTPAGTLTSAIRRLPHLVDLGVTHVEVMPLAAFAGSRGWGYDGVFWSAPHPAYGSPDDVRRFVDACHGHGLGVLVDVVYNHLGPAGNVLPRFGPYLTDRHRTPWGDAINLDGPGSDEVRARIVDDALTWIVDRHADGLRLDAIHALADDSPTHLLAELSAEVDRVAASSGREIVLVAETDLHDPTPVDPRDGGGYGLTAQWADDLHHAIHAFVTGEQHGYYADYGDGALIADALVHVHTLRGQRSQHRGEPVGRPVDDRPHGRFVVALQNHDQIGNRARGERLSDLVGARCAAAVAPLVLLAPTTPMIFQGEEWAASTPFPYFADHVGDLADAIRRGRRAEFGWELDPSDLPDALAEETFLAATLDWSELADDPHRSILDWYRTLLRLRATEADLGTSTPVEAEWSDEAVTMRRGRWTVFVNLSSTETATMPSGRLRYRSPFSEPLSPELVGPRSSVLVEHG